MAEAVIKFEREDREGVVPVGTYLSDAAKRFGIHFEDMCDAEADSHCCSLVIASGSALMSPLTKIESEYFAKHRRKTNERLACQVKIEKSGDVVIMTKEKPKDPTSETSAEDRNEQYKKEFAEMPLEKKIASLVQLETIALGETVSFVINSPFLIADKVMDVMAEFGFKKEERQKEAARPAEHKSDTDGSDKEVKANKAPKSEAPAS
jgi:ferredoxin